MDYKTIMAWLQLIFNVAEKGRPAIDAVLEAARGHGVELDNEKLDEIIADATARGARREAEAQG